MSNAQTQTPQANGRVLQDVSSLEREIAELKAALAAKATPGRISYKVGAAGGLSVYGLQQFPVTLYAKQWENLVAAIQAGDVTRFIAAHEGDGSGAPFEQRTVKVKGVETVITACTTLKRK